MIKLNGHMFVYQKTSTSMLWKIRRCPQMFDKVLEMNTFAKYGLFGVHLHAKCQ